MIETNTTGDSYYGSCGMNYGWICPRCHRTYSPYVQSCYACSATYYHWRPYPYEPYVPYWTVTTSTGHLSINDGKTCGHVNNDVDNSDE